MLLALSSVSSPTISLLAWLTNPPHTHIVYVQINIFDYRAVAIGGRLRGRQLVIPRNM